MVMQPPKQFYPDQNKTLQEVRNIAYSERDRILEILGHTDVLKKIQQCKTGASYRRLLKNLIDGDIKP